MCVEIHLAHDGHDSLAEFDLLPVAEDCINLSVHEYHPDNRIQCIFCSHDRLDTEIHVSLPGGDSRYLSQLQGVAAGVVEESRSIVSIDRVQPSLGNEN